MIPLVAALVLVSLFALSGWLFYYIEAAEVDRLLAQSVQQRAENAVIDLTDLDHAATPADILNWGGES